MIKEIQKSAYEVFPVTVDFLDELAAGEIIASIDSVVSTPVNIVASSSFTSTTITATLSGGTNDTSNRLVLRVITNIGNKLELVIPVIVKEVVAGYFSKSTNEKMAIAADFVDLLTSGETISTYTVTALDTLTGLDATSTVIAGYAIVNQGVRFTVMSGNSGTAYKIPVRIVTSSANSYESIITMKVT